MGFAGSWYSERAGLVDKAINPKRKKKNPLDRHEELH
jgi:hypothetical protein